MSWCDDDLHDYIESQREDVYLEVFQRFCDKGEFNSKSAFVQEIFDAMVEHGGLDVILKLSKREQAGLYYNDDDFYNLLLEERCD